MTLDIAENVRFIRDQLLGNRGRDVEWELQKDSTVGEPDAKKASFDGATFHVKLPARDKDGKAEKIVHKFHLIMRNEW